MEACWAWVEAARSGGRASYTRLQRFLSDHRKALVCLAVTGGVAAYAVYRVGRGYRELQEASLHRLRLRGAFESTQSTCAGTAPAQVRKLNEAVVRLVPIPSPQDLRASLQQSPQDGQSRYALWDHCKAQTFTRLVVTVYGVVLLSTFLRVQVNLLGRYLYLESLIVKDPTARTKIPLEVALPQDTQKRFLAYADYLLNSGLKQLIVHVHSISQQVLSNYPLQQNCSFEDMLIIVDTIRQRMEQPISNDTNETVLNSFLLPQECTEDDNAQRDHKLAMLINETRDVLESFEFNQILTRCFNLGFYTMSQHLHSCFLPQPETPDLSRNFATATSDGSTTLPMAKLMPLINKEVSKLLAADPNPFLEATLYDAQLRQYAFDLFATFGESNQK